MTEKNFEKVTHCIFDMDGLLLVCHNDTLKDSETLYNKAYNTILQRYGKEYTMELNVKVMGMRSNEAAETIANALELPITGPQFQAELMTIYHDIFSKCDLMPGAEELVQHLKKHGVPIALATSSSKETADIKTQRWKHIFNLFDHKVFGSSDPEVKKGKPNPDIFFIAAKRFPSNPEPAKCLVFEDAPNGVEAAVNAGMQVVMVPDPKLPKNLTQKATMVLNSLKDFKPENFGLPPYAA